MASYSPGVATRFEATHEEIPMTAIANMPSPTPRSRRTRLAATLAAVLALAGGATVLAPAPALAAGYTVDRYAHVVGVDVYDQLNMRRWPAAHSQKVGAIPHHGDGFYVQRCIARPHGASSDWCKVNYGGRWGWVNKRFLGFY